MSKGLELKKFVFDKHKIKNSIVGPIGSLFVAIAIGICTGLGAVAFRGAISLFHNLFFGGFFSIHYDASVHTPISRWGTAIILAPVMGSVIVTFLVTRFAPEAKGHGVPEVIEAVYYKKGVIRPHIVWIKAIASSISIGSGGSVGREGPIIQIGSAFGSWIGQVFNVPPWERITWLACGAGGGIAATFNTPIGGILFATEIILQEVSVRTLVPVALATATASYIGRLFFGASPAFVIPISYIQSIELSNPVLLIAYAVLGVLLGFISQLFVLSIYKGEDFFEAAIPGRPFLRHMIGMFVVGVIIYVMVRLTGHYYVEGVGYAAIQDVLSGHMPVTNTLALFLLLLFFAKLLTTSLTLGSGASGGVFSPALFLGAMFGEAYGLLLQKVLPHLVTAPESFAIVGMAAIVGGSTGAAVTAIVMVYEMTLDYSVIVPMTITVAISYAVRNLISKQSIYTLKLQRRGHAIPNALQANLAFIKKAGELVDTRFSVLSSHMDVDHFFSEVTDFHASVFFVVEENKRPVGIITYEDVIKAKGKGLKARLGELAGNDFILVSQDSPLTLVIEKLGRGNAKFILVMKDSFGTSIEGVLGLLPKERITDTLIEQSELFSSEVD
jgi:CIC family chloride channel protein